jgi:hypothetical protein
MGANMPAMIEIDGGERIGLSQHVGNAVRVPSLHGG